MDFSGVMLLIIGAFMLGSFVGWFIKDEKKKAVK